MNLRKLIFCAVVGFALVESVSPTSAAPKTEDELIAALVSPKQRIVINALDDLEKEYPNSPNSLPKIKALLGDKRIDVRVRTVCLLGAIHAKVNDDDLKNISKMLESSNWHEQVNTLRALRGMEARNVVSSIIPLLQNSKVKVKREACRTLAILGDNSVIKDIEPLLSDPDSNVQKTAKDVIYALNNK